MSDSTAARQATALRVLQERFQATIGKTLDAFRQLASQLALRPDAPEVLDALRRELHRVHGTAGSYGFAEASRIAGDAEARAIAWARDPHLELGERVAALRTFIAALDAAFRASDELPVADSTNAQPVVLVVGDENAFRALQADPRARQFALRALSLDQAQRTILRDIAPVVVAVPAEHAARIAQDARDLAIPVIAMESRARDGRDASPPTADSGVTLVDVTAGVSAVLDIAERSAVRAATGGVTILALDDDPAILAMVTYVLERPGVTVRTIGDASALADALETQVPSLLLSDINMPGATGIELTRALRADARYRDLPIVLLSSETDASSRDAALRAGANEFVSKPIAAAELRHRIADRLDRHRLERLAAGLHPVSGLPSGPRATRDAAEAFDAVVSDGAPCTVVVLRPATGDRTGDEQPAWLREVVRVARGLGASARFVGHHDGTSLLAILALGSADSAARLSGLASGAPADAPRWHAGIVERADAPRADLTLLRRHAEDAVDVARVMGQEVVRRWQRDEALIAPDVVVVEDDPALSDMLQYALRTSGFTYRAFSNGRHALDFLLSARTQDRRPIVLLDVDLPGLDGYSLHERLAVERAGAYSVVFVTVHGAESDQLRALKGGAIDFVIKPLNLRILLAKMSSWTMASRRTAARS